MTQKSPALYDPKQDPEFQKPYVDIDEWRTGTVRYHYIHGGFEGTELRFSFYFPEKENYRGRFYHFMSPVQGSEDASQVRNGEEDRIAFAITNGAYFVESNMGGPAALGETIYRTSAAAAEYSRDIAVGLFGPHRPFGYIYGGSGGGYKTMSCFENTNAWDGALPFVIGSPMSIPNNFTVGQHALRILRNKIPMIADAMEPGGSGDMYVGLDPEERAALEEFTRMGFPTRAWIPQQSTDLGALPLFIPVIEQMDPTYFEDFWTVPGYLGADPNGSAARDRLQHRTVIAEADLSGKDIQAKEENKTGVDDAWQRFKGIDISVFQPWMRLESVPAGDDLYLTGTNIVFLSGDAAGQKVPLDRLEGNIAYVAEGFGVQGMVEILEKVKAGDEIMLDNSNFIALQTYHRHQVPSADYKAWDQFRDEEGKPLYPQRSMLISPMITHGGAGSVQSGRINGKMIVIAALLDGAFPWQPDWYRTKVKEHLGDKEPEQFRLWYIDHAVHSDEAVTGNELRFVSYLGALYQGLLDLSDWVEQGIAPPDSTQYTVIDGQVIVPPGARERQGVQPVVALKADGRSCAVVTAGETVHFAADVEVPDRAGKLTAAEWSFEGETDYPVKGEFASLSSDGTKAVVKTEYRFTKPGTYFPVLRVRSNRQGDIRDAFTQVKNLSRVRVIVK